MGIAALIAWVITAIGGFVMLGRWISRGGMRQQAGGTTRFPAGLVFSHFGLAAAGLVIWIVYLLVELQRLAWTAFALTIVVTLLGIVMFARWLPVYRSRTVATVSGPGTGAPPGEEPAERQLPVPVVVAHGVFAAVTVVLVLLATLGGGG